MLKISKNGVIFRWPSVFPNHDDLVFLLAWFVDKALLDTMLQYDAVLSDRFLTIT